MNCRSAAVRLGPDRPVIKARICSSQDQMPGKALGVIRGTIRATCRPLKMIMVH
jgi:hypothetical protein